MTADALDAEDQKIITLARSTRARVAASEGAAVRDETGRTYTAAAVALPSLRLSALRLAVAMAVSSGAESLEAAALVSDSDPDPGDLAAVRDLGPTAPVFHAAPDGTLRATLTPYPTPPPPPAPAPRSRAPSPADASFPRAQPRVPTPRTLSPTRPIAPACRRHPPPSGPIALLGRQE